jgi:glucokinase
MAALAGTDELAVEAVDMFLAIIGAEAGYICGGITPKV